MSEVATENVLNVTLLSPKEKHPTIFSRIDNLINGESLIILNDHNPKPLYYHLQSEKGNIFDWEYLQDGPEWWKVKITKRIANKTEETIGEMVANNFNKIEVFKKYGIDFCCNGKRTLQQACEKKGLDYKLIADELNKTDVAERDHAIPYHEWNLDFLADYIVNTYHTYVNKAVVSLKDLSDKVANAHAKEHNELLQINSLVAALHDEMLTHQMKEERILFPYIKQLLLAKSMQQIPQAAHFGTVKSPINMMEMEHESAGEIMASIRQLTNNYQLPANACTSYTVFYKMLLEFETKLHEHIHLENNLLFPKAILLEQDLIRQQ